MKQHALTQGSQEWLAHRLGFLNASDAPAMMGCSAYKTRTQLLHEMHTGMAPEVDAATQRRFDDGHRFEALARPLAEEIIGEELYPVVGSNGELSASFDGLTMDESINFEHKSLNDELRAAIPPEDLGVGDTEVGGALPLQYRVQMEQQHMVSGCEKTLFMASKWQGEDLVEERHCWYESDPALRQQIIDGWTQFAADLAVYVPAEVVMAPVAKPQMNLPAVSIQVNGSIALVDNLQAFGTALTAYVERINKTPETDQDFADLEATVKTLKNAEEALDAAENGALAQTESIDSMRRTVGLYRETARTNRLLVEKLVKVEKENRRTKIVTDGIKAFSEHIDSLNTRLGKHYMPAIAADFHGAVRSLKSIDSMRDKVAGELARAKIEANAVADKIQANLTTLRELASEHAFLFADTPAIVLKAPDDLTALVKLRIAEHKAAEAAKEEATRERIRAEEQEKADAKAKLIQVNLNNLAVYGQWNDPLALTVLRERRAALELEPVDHDTYGERIEEAVKMRDFALQTINDAISQGEKIALEQKAVACEAMTPAIAPATRYGNGYNPLGALPIATKELEGEKILPEMVPLTPQQAATRILAARLPTKPTTPPTMSLGSISERLGFNVTSAFLATLGFEATTVRAAKLYHEEDFPAIGRKLIEHIESVCELQAA